MLEKMILMSRSSCFAVAISMSLLVHSLGTYVRGGEGVVIADQDFVTPNEQWSLDSFYYPSFHDSYSPYYFLPGTVSSLGPYQLRSIGVDSNGARLWMQYGHVVGIDMRTWSYAVHYGPVKLLRELGRFESENESHIYLLDTADDGRFSRQFYILSLYDFGQSGIYSLQFGYSQDVISLDFIRDPFLDYIAFGVW